MAFRLFSKVNKTANLIFTDYAIRFVEMKQTSPMIVQQYEERILPSGLIEKGSIIDYEGLLEIVENCVTDWKIKNRPVRFNVQDDYITVRTETLTEDLEDDEIESYLFLQIGKTIHLPFEDPVFDSVVVGEKDGKKEVLLIAAPEEEVRQYQNLLEDAKLKPIAADIDALCLYRLFTLKNLTNPKEHEMVLHIKKRTLTASIYNDHQLAFMKPIFFGEKETVDGQISEGAFLEDALNECQNVVNFYENSLHKGQVHIEKIFISGEHERRTFIEDYIEKSFEMKIIKQDEMVVKDKDGRAVPEIYHPAVGLGLKEV
ncbi:type IV pilus assembly protein PilM [Oikeobacillus pervagus]|uniref:Type IV pilus assembly protein PilM n=1 Tax=Oikeobacillus pervagus TaxID=1325931 RepID=A0AAJ1WIE5_9BACI|nr:pilus assembly protein PilM [Oikeobacillus pervagus]MDQ0214545.1 type IV pilus assembly protein PilM [Oikeobacillus pervagus]